MGVWMELHCDYRHDGICLNHLNDNPSGMFSSGQANVKDGYDYLMLTATSQQWTKIGKKWCCPKCREKEEPGFKFQPPKSPKTVTIEYDIQTIKK